MRATTARSGIARGLKQVVNIGGVAYRSRFARHVRAKGPVDQFGVIATPVKVEAAGSNPVRTATHPFEDAVGSGSSVGRAAA